MQGSEAKVEVAAGAGGNRRRSWSKDEKRRIVAETFEPGASVSVVARRHDLNANMLFTWRRATGAIGAPAPGNMVTFVPAAITSEPASPLSPVPAGRMEIVLASGDRVMVGVDVDTVALARVVKVLSRR